MASGDAKPVPQKNVAYRITFPILDADGDLVTGAASLDSEISKDGGTFTDCTNEATEIATSSGMYYLDLTSTEMNADTVAIIVKTATSGAKTTPIVMYPEEAGDIRVSISTGGIAAASFAAGAIDAAAIAADAIDDSAIASDVTAVIAGAVWNAATASYGTANTYGALVETNLDAAVSTRASQTSVDTVDDFLDTEVAAILADTNELQTDWVNGGRLDLLIDAIKAKTDNLPAAPAATGDIPSAATIADAVWDEATSGHVTSGTFGQEAATIRANTAQAGAAGTITLDASASASDDFYNYSVIKITAGTGAGQSRIISDYVGSSKVASVGHNWVTNPSSDSVFVILPFGSIPGATAPTASEVADAVWDEALSGHTTAGTTGKALSDAGSAGDPWGTALPGAYSAGQAGYIVGTNLNATVSSRLASASYTAPLDAAGTRSAVGLASANLDTQLDALPTAAENADAVWDEARSGHSTAGSFGQGVASVQGNVTGSVGSVTGAVGSVTGNVGGNVTGSVGSLATQAKADVNAEVDASIETYHLDHLLATTYDPASKPGAADALLNELVENDGGVSRYTANALEQAPSGTGASASDIADAVWDEAIAGHLSAGSTGESLNNATAAGNPWAAVIEGALTAEDILRILAGVAAGKTTIATSGGGSATITFRNITDSGDIVEASMQGSERQAVTVTP